MMNLNLTRSTMGNNGAGFTLANGENARFCKMGDSYGRSVSALHVGGRVIGVVVKHPLKKSGEAGSYWFTAWSGPSAQKSPTYFASINDAKKWAAHYANGMSIASMA